MAVTKTTTISALGGKLIIDFDADTSYENDVTAATSGILYLVEVDNTANASTSAYLRIIDRASADASNDVPTWMFVAAPGAKSSYLMPEGQAYSAGLSIWCTSNNAKDDATAPASAVIVRLIAT